MPETALTKTAVLGNGIKIITERIPNIRSVTVGIWLLSGSRHERPEQSGTYHFLEHLVFKRTETRSTREIAKIIDTVGGHCNAFTDKEYTCFYAKAMDEHIDVILDLLSDIVIRPVFLAEDIEGEKRVVLEEIKMVEDQPEHVLHNRMMQSIWKDHPLSRPTVGTRESVLSLTAADMEAFYRAEMRAGRMLITAAGNLDHDEIAGKLEKYFSEVPPGGEVLKGEPPVYTRSMVREQKNEMQQIHLCLLVPTFPRNHPDRFNLAVFITLLGTGMSSRLFQKVREERGLVYDIDTEGVTYTDSGYLVVYAGTSQESLNEVVSITIDEFRDLKRVAPQADEVGRAKEHLKGSLMLGLENTFQRMAHLASQEIYYGRQASLDEIISSIEAVTVKGVHELGERIFTSNPVSSGILGKVEAIELMEDALRC